MSIGAGLSLLSATAAFSQDVSKITCSFRAEGFEGGKSHVVSCAMNPQEVFSTNRRQQAPGEMCDQKSNAFQENYENYVVDLPNRSINYNGVLIVSDFAKADYIQHRMSEGESREQATVAADKKTVREMAHNIDNVDVGVRQIFFKLTGGVYNPPKEMPTYIVRYGESTLYYTVGVPEAVIVEATGDERHSWVAMRFGLCESE
ncbi:hypothetical protein GOD71_32220 [Sinorhizobium medicae]|nr:hypothetical protein [Sinorhizobium medicae]MDX0742052.1 hypothetical protein [Sinorhizobium medicae]MDX2330305.1 hypothetical protein [Sinorhizobium medicae]